jgi:hypothetical protein
MDGRFQGRMWRPEASPSSARKGSAFTRRQTPYTGLSAIVAKRRLPLSTAARQCHHCLLPLQTAVADGQPPHRSPRYAIEHGRAEDVRATAAVTVQSFRAREAVGLPPLKDPPTAQI